MDQNQDSDIEGNYRIDHKWHKIAAWLEANHKEVLTDQKHLDEGSPERAYFHYGYLMALHDVAMAQQNNRQWFKPGKYLMEFD